MVSDKDYAGLIEQLRNHEERWECAGGSGWETPEVCIEAATALSILLSRAEAAEARLAEALKALAEVRRRARNIWGACSSDQIIDKDVERQAKLMLEYIDAARACLEKGKSHD